MQLCIYYFEYANESIKRDVYVADSRIQVVD